MTRTTLAIMIAVACAAPCVAQAQRTPPRRQDPIEIRGQVPTPQVVTVRPREVPNYDRRVLVPTFYDHDFWQAVLPGYLLVREHMITGSVPGDTARRDPPRPTPATPPPAGAGAPPGSITPPPPETPSAETEAPPTPAPAGSPALPPR